MNENAKKINENRAYRVNPFPILDSLLASLSSLHLVCRCSIFRYNQAFFFSCYKIHMSNKSHVDTDLPKASILSSGSHSFEPHHVCTANTATEKYMSVMKTQEIKNKHVENCKECKS